MAKVIFPLGLPYVSGQLGKTIVFENTKYGIIAQSYPESLVGRDRSSLPQNRVFRDAMRWWSRFRDFPGFICGMNLSAVLKSFGITGNSQFVKEYFRGIRANKEFYPFQVSRFYVSGDNLVLEFSTSACDGLYFDFGSTKSQNSVRVPVPSGSTRLEIPLSSLPAGPDSYFSFGVSSSQYFVISPRIRI